MSTQSSENKNVKSLTVSECLNLILPFQNLSLQATVYGMCGEAGEFIEECGKPLTRESKTKLANELADVVIYTFLYLQLSSLQTHLKDKNLFVKDLPRFIISNHPGMLGLILPILQIAEIEKKILRGSVERSRMIIVNQIFQILGAAVKIAQEFGLELEVAIRAKVVENQMRNERGEYGL